MSVVPFWSEGLARWFKRKHAQSARFSKRIYEEFVEMAPLLTQC